MNVQTIKGPVSIGVMKVGTVVMYYAGGKLDGTQNPAHITGFLRDAAGKLTLQIRLLAGATPIAVEFNWIEVL